MGAKSAPQAAAPDPKLTAKQIESMDIQDSAITTMMDNSRALLPLQREQMQFGMDTSRTAYDQSQQDRQWSLGRRDRLTDAQDSFSQKVDEYDSEGQREALAGMAIGDVNQAFSSARDQQSRSMSRMGVDPGSGRALAMGNQLSIAQATAQANAANKVRAAAKAEGFSLQAQKANMLSGYPAMASGNTAAGAGYGASGLSIANSGLAGMNSGYNAAGGMAGSMGTNASNMYGAQSQFNLGNAKLQAEGADPFGAILGQGLGAFATSYGTKLAMSDRRLKTDIVLVGKTLSGFNIYSFRYKAGGPTVMGVMADEVEKVLPQAVHKRAIAGEFDAVDYALL